MAIIRAKGLYQGERLAACSDLAQLQWPRLYLYGNGFSRFEINVSLIIATVYASLRVKPTEEDIFRWLGEYQDNFLLFIYGDPATGAPWAQWLTAKENLATYRTAEDNRSPAPDEDAIEEYRQAYRDFKRAKFQKSIDISKPFQTLVNLPKPLGTYTGYFESFPTASIGGGFEMNRSGKGVEGGDGFEKASTYRGNPAKRIPTRHSKSVSKPVIGSKEPSETIDEDPDDEF
jgi:hypothetical protein